MPNTPPNLMANGNIYPCRFVKLDTSADFKVIQATANSDILGVSQEGSNYPPLSDLSVSAYAAQAGQNIRLFGDGDVCLVTAGGVITRGDKLKSDANGKAVSIATTGTTLQKYGGIALQSAAAEDEKILIQVLAMRSERPAIT